MFYVLLLPRRHWSKTPRILSDKSLTSKAITKSSGWNRRPTAKKEPKLIGPPDTYRVLNLTNQNLFIYFLKGSKSWNFQFDRSLHFSHSHSVSVTWLLKIRGKPVDLAWSAHGVKKCLLCLSQSRTVRFFGGLWESVKRPTGTMPKNQSETSKSGHLARAQRNQALKGFPFPWFLSFCFLLLLPTI